jgi:hypothetical protein
MDAPEIDYSETESRGLYKVRSAPGEPVAHMTLSKAGEHLIIIDHTEVPDALSGRGLGVALVARAVADARAAGKRIVPLCPYAAAQFRRHPEWHDVLDR